ncbi:hypothetical protein [Anabaena lutea]|uniref:Uncharacterized protein n=1 Tax=Anabaena lutea FACHB-196 TaxID=2692881 RepID=A0ABR8FIT3_9NOST|nr:hypothetical protein [Anabaena lutea]MBD2570028.1 hypothetical protein [Anabaena lutea FACHB-196]
MMPAILRRYEISLIDAIDALITKLMTWEDGQFSASEVSLSRREAQEIAAWVINSAADPFGFCGASLNGDRLLELLRNIREEGNDSV